MHHAGVGVLPGGLFINAQVQGECFHIFFHPGDMVGRVHVFQVTGCRQLVDGLNVGLKDLPRALSNLLFQLRTEFDQLLIKVELLLDQYPVAQVRLHPAAQFHFPKRLLDAQIQQIIQNGLFLLGCNDNDRGLIKLVVGTNQVAQFLAVHHRHKQVGDDQVKFLPGF